MRATVFVEPGRVGLENVPDPSIVDPGDVVVRVVRAGVCGTDLWWFRGLAPRETGSRLGHEFIGEVVAVGAGVRTLEHGDLVVAPFTFSDGSCPACRAGWPTSCENGAAWGAKGTDGGQAEYVRAPMADATLVRAAAAGEWPGEDVLASLLTLADVMSTGHHAAVSAGVRDGSTVVVVGDGAVGLCGVLAAARLGAARIVALSRHPDRRRRARAFGATDLVDERGKEAVSGVRELLGGTGADAVLECVGTEESLSSALGIVRDGGRVGYVGMPHAAPIDLARLFRRNVTIGGGMAPARIYIPGLLDDVLERRIRPGAVLTDAFDLADVQRAYEGMDRREIVKAMLSP